MSLIANVRQLLNEEPVPPPAYLHELRDKVCEGAPLAWDEMAQSVRLLLDGVAPEEDRLLYLETLHPDVATGEMLAAAAAVLRELAPRIPFESDLVFDCCGTGGDRLGLFNVSTLAGIVIAAAGVPVAKHGNRAITSGCGSADLLEALGVPIELTPDQAAKSLEEIGIAFLFAPFYHQATRNVQPLRKQLSARGIPTLFNLLGPLSNPALPSHQLVGVFSPRYQRAVAEALHLLGIERGWVVCGKAEGERWMDEFSPIGDTEVYRVEGERIIHDRVAAFGAHSGATSLAAFVGGDAAHNAGLARSVLAGEASPFADAVCLNAGAGLCVSGKVPDVSLGVEMSEDLIKSGKAADLLRRWAGVA